MSKFVINKIAKSFFKFQLKGGVYMCLDGFDPCQDDLGALRTKHEHNEKIRVRPPCPKPANEFSCKKEKLPAEMPSDDPSYFEHILY
jgi:hypothetical protein